MSRTTTVAVILALPAGALLQLAVQAVTKMSPDDVSALSKITVFSVTAAGFSSAGWFGPKSLLELHQDRVRMRRHRRVSAPREERPAPAPAEIEETPARAEEAGSSMAVRPRALDASAVDWPRLPETDPYLTPAVPAGPAAEPRTVPAVVDADGYPAPPFGTAEDAAQRLDGRRDTAVIPAHDEDPDGWEQLRAPAVTRSEDDLLWYATGPA